MSDDTIVRVAQALSESSEFHGIDGSFLLGFVSVAEWQGADGNRWLTVLQGNGAGENVIPKWQTRGYLHEALFCWPTNESGEADDD